MTVAGPPEIESRADNGGARWSLWKSTGVARVVVGALVLSVIFLVVLLVFLYAAGFAYDAFKYPVSSFIPVLVLSEFGSTVIVPAFFTRSWKEGAVAGFLSLPFMLFLTFPVEFAVQNALFPGIIGLAGLPLLSLYLPFLMPATTLLGLVGGRLGGRRASKKAEVRQGPSPPDNSTPIK